MDGDKHFKTHPRDSGLQKELMFKDL